jgi:hypothetical protein
MRSFNLLHLATILAGLIILTGLSSCKKDVEEIPTTTPTGYNVPAVYNFSNVNYTGQTARLNMLDEISAYMNTANQGAVLSAETLKNMYSNANNPFNDTALNTSGKQLKDKTYFEDQAYFDELFENLALVSESAGSEASNGIAGIENGRLLDENGIEIAQVITKQLMGAVFYYQAVETYLSNLPFDDNITVEEGSGTAQEHHADEAFGYFGVPIDFPANLNDLRYWGKYCDEVNAAITSNTPAMNGFLKLRAAISNKDNATRDIEITNIKKQWERVAAASAIIELKSAKSAFNNVNLSQMRHVLSEALGFIKAMRYNADKQITNAQINDALDALGTNFYTITLSDIDNCINTINDAYSFDLNEF